MKKVVLQTIKKYLTVANVSEHTHGSRILIQSNFRQIVQRLNKTIQNGTIIIN